MDFVSGKKGKLMQAKGINALNEATLTELTTFLDQRDTGESFLLELDLSESKEITAAGIAGLLRIYQKLTSNGGNVIISAINKNHASVFRLLRLTRFFDIKEKSTKGIRV